MHISWDILYVRSLLQDTGFCYGNYGYHILMAQYKFLKVSILDNLEVLCIWKLCSIYFNIWFDNDRETASIYLIKQLSDATNKQLSECVVKVGGRQVQTQQIILYFVPKKDYSLLWIYIHGLLEKYLEYSIIMWKLIDKLFQNDSVVFNLK